MTIDKAGFSAWRHFAELKYLKSETLAAELLEARIAVCLAGQIRPSGLMRALNSLCELRLQQGQPELFRSFEDLLRVNGDDIRLTNHDFRTEVFADMDHRPVWDHVRGHIDRLADRGYEAFLNSGTLLGVVRDNQLIAHDDDVDLAMILKAGSVEDAAREWLELTAEFDAAGLLDRANFNNPAIIKLRPLDQVQVDLFPAWFQDDALYLYPHTFGGLRRDQVLPLKTCDVAGNPIPADPEAMLALNYGPNWRVPDPYFKFPWANARVTFDAFLIALDKGETR